MARAKVRVGIVGAGPIGGLGRRELAVRRLSAL